MVGRRGDATAPNTHPHTHTPTHPHPHRLLRPQGAPLYHRHGSSGDDFIWDPNTNRYYNSHIYIYGLLIVYSSSIVVDSRLLLVANRLLVVYYAIVLVY